MSSSQIAEPWNSFLSDLDRGLSTRLVLHCLGGFAINLTYGLSRQTADIDMCEVAPITTKTDVLALAGEGSALHKKHSVCLQVVKMASLPYYYEERLNEPFRGAFRQLQLLVLDPYRPGAQQAPPKLRCRYRGREVSRRIGPPGPQRAAIAVLRGSSPLLDRPTRAGRQGRRPVVRRHQ